MKKYLKDFFVKNEGVETIEFIALIAVAAALVIVIANIGGSMASSADDTQTEMESALNKLKDIGK